MMKVQTVDPETKLQKAYQAAKRNGKLGLGNCGLTSFPESLHKFNEVTAQGDNWWEDIPLSAIDLSNNKIE